MYPPRTYPGISSLLIVFAGGVSTSCIPPYAEYQGARLAGPGRVEFTGFYSALWTSAEGETEKIQDHFGLQVAAGLTDVLDLRMRYERIEIENDGLNVVGAGPKLRLVRDRMAFYAPVGTAFGEDVESSELWQVQPTLLLTVPAAPAVDVNASFKTLIWLNNDSDELFAFNVGLGLRPASGNIEFRPEAGYLWNPGETGHSFHLGVGLGILTGR